MKKKVYYSIGVMSGTSLDGFDFSLIKSDGIFKIEVVKNQYFSIHDNLRKKIKLIIVKINQDYYKTVNSDFFIDLQKEFSKQIIFYTKKFLKDNNLKNSVIDVIGIHGVTLYHSVYKKKSLQIGDHQFISNKLQTKVVGNFRENDLNLNGQGAPLVPIYHQAIFSKPSKNFLVINIGGISNYTLLIGENKIFSSDIGPGNVLLDNFCQKYFNINCDFEGVNSLMGKINFDLIDLWKKKKIINQKHPISFDNFSFKLEDYIFQQINLNDNLRSLTYFTACLICDLEKKIKFKIDKWILTGGGIKNKTLISDIHDLITKKKVNYPEKFGFDSDFIESQAFAFISIRTLKGLVSAFPETTGCEKSNVCGKIFVPNKN